MRHRKKRNLLNRFTSWRKATVVSLAKNLLVHQRVITTKAKAKATAPLVERLITLAKEGSLSSRRKAYQILGQHRLVSYLFDDLISLFKNRTSGFSRIIAYKNRRGDNAKLVIFELTEKKEKPKRIKKEKEEIKEKPKPQEEKLERKPPVEEKPARRFLGSLRRIFKKERDAL
jgi:large subunit ribosomal protein L17